MRAWAMQGLVAAAMLAPPIAHAAPTSALSDSAGPRQGWGLVVNRDGRQSDLKSLGASLQDGTLRSQAITAGYGWRRGQVAALVVGYDQPASDAAAPGAMPANPRYPGQAGEATPSVLGVSFTFRR